MRSEGTAWLLWRVIDSRFSYALKKLLTERTRYAGRWSVCAKCPNDAGTRDPNRYEKFLTVEALRGQTHDCCQTKLIDTKIRDSYREIRLFLRVGEPRFEFSYFGNSYSSCGGRSIHGQNLPCGTNFHPSLRTTSHIHIQCPPRNHTTCLHD